mmetsp:Transcript_81400/g.263634  ORF Transcript_81400/g.263634 Transcript_81400/m.263634 type:complete len:173 (-) Transcript_81400:50-568(-)
MFIRPVTKNDAVRRFITVLCRYFGNEWDPTLQKDVKYAEDAVRSCVDDAVVDVIKEICEKLMQSVSLNRYADRKAPWVFIYNLATFPKWHADNIWKETMQMRDEKLEPLLGDRTLAVWKVCVFSAWGEQNTRDWDGAQGAALTGAVWGFHKSLLEDRAVVEKFAPHMGFDDS